MCLVPAVHAAVSLGVPSWQFHFACAFHLNAFRSVSSAIGPGESPGRFKDAAATQSCSHLEKTRAGVRPPAPASEWQCRQSARGVTGVVQVPRKVVRRQRGVPSGELDDHVGHWRGSCDAHQEREEAKHRLLGGRGSAGQLAAKSGECVLLIKIAE